MGEKELELLRADEFLALETWPSVPIHMEMPMVMTFATHSPYPLSSHFGNAKNGLDD